MSRYEILERIGMGGMAEVFRGVAISEAGFRKPVAIKKILPHLGRDQRFVQMLIAEAKMLASLRQRSIVQIYDLGQDEEEQYFLVMEYVDGMDLADLQEFLEERGEKLDPSIAVHIGAEVADALDHAHTSKAAPGGKGVIHRDVSPANVLLAFSGEVKLTDFGIAKHGEQSIIASLKGKFAYMSPEQARAMPVDGATDQFSLALVLYELMTGRRVFSHLGDLDALRLAREGTIPPPSVADPEFPADVEPILMKALDPDPRRRYPSAGELARALRRARLALRATEEPPAALGTLLRRFGLPRGPGKERAPVDKRHSEVKLSTAFLFDDLDLGRSGGDEPLATDEAAVSGGSLPLMESDDAATTIGPPPTAPPGIHEAPTVGQVLDDEGEDLRKTTTMRAVESGPPTKVPPGSAYPGFAPPKLLVGSAHESSPPLPGLPPAREPVTDSWTPPPVLAGADVAALVPASPPISLRKAGLVIAAVVGAVVIFAAIVADDAREPVTIPTDEAVEIATPDAAAAPPDARPARKKKRRRAR